MPDFDDYLKANEGRFEKELAEFLRIPSVSADPGHAADVRRAANFVADHLNKIGLAVETIDTAGFPLIIAESPKVAGAPTLLIYGHYDVQPPDPLDLWITGPFEPTVRDGNIYARGATDDKGQMFTYIKALEAWQARAGHFPINVKVIIEGEEEVGSEAIIEYMQREGQRLACDYVAISDSCQLGPDQPAITCGLRGISYFELRVQGPNRDLHSGTFGGSVQNPINALTTILAALKDERGRIRIPGFYDEVLEPTAAERQAFASLPFSDTEYQKDLGVADLFGEAGYSTLERRWVRPTCDINGIYGGYQGEGAKTVLPAKAGAKVSFRLVPQQDPVKLDRSFRDFVRSVTPPGVTVDIHTYQGSEGVVTPIDSPGIRAAVKAIEKGFGRKPFFIREGGSIPIVSTFKSVLGADSLLLGYGLPDDNTHSPNEKLSLRDFHRGIRTNVHLLAELAEEAKGTE